jgi:DNA-binding cell septation regulator SpoVG
MKVSAINIRKYEKNTLRGFFSLEMEGLLTIHECSVHVKGDAWWIGMPAKSYQNAQGEQKWQPFVYMDKERLKKLRDLIKDDLRELLSDAPEPMTRSRSAPRQNYQSSDKQKMLEDAKKWEIPDDDPIPF